MAFDRVPPEIMAKIQEALKNNSGVDFVDPATGMQWMSNVGMFGDTPKLQQIIAGTPGKMTNGDTFLNFDTTSGAFTGQQQFEKDQGFGSFALKAGLGIGGLAFGASTLFSGLGSGAASATGGGMDFGDIFGAGDGGFGPFDSGSLDSGAFDAGGLNSFDDGSMQSILDSGAGGSSSTGGLLQNMIKSLGGGTKDLGGFMNLLSPLSKLITSEHSNNVAKDFADKLIERSDPFFKYRAGYGDRLAELEKSHDVTQIPGYQAGLEAVQRAGASQGFTGSGNMMKALQDYGGNFYNTEANRLATLAGAGATPGAGVGPAAQLSGQGLATQGYGIDAVLQALGKMDFSGGGGGSMPTPSTGGMNPQGLA